MPKKSKILTSFTEVNLKNKPTYKWINKQV